MPPSARLSAGAFFLVVALAFPHSVDASQANIPALVDSYAARYKIPPEIARNLVRVESGGRQSAVSRTGARGVMQLLPATARALGVDINDPEQNIEGGMRYLRFQYDRFGRWDLALAAYHSGPRAVLECRCVPSKSETYVRRIMGNRASPVSIERRPRQSASRGGNAESRQLDSAFLWPVQGPITQGFGQSGRQFHSGIDISAPHGTPIRAARVGRVMLAEWHYGFGRTVILDHGNGVSTLYGHASSLLVSAGEDVQAGEVIARVGCTGRCTGPHLHFEVRVNGRAVDPLSPRTNVAAKTPDRNPLVENTEAPMLTKTESRTESRRESGQRKSVTVKGDTVTTVTDTIRKGRVVRRVEEIVFVQGQLQIRILREFRLKNGVLKLIKERVRVKLLDDDEDDDDEDEDDDD